MKKNKLISYDEFHKQIEQDYLETFSKEIEIAKSKTPKIYKIISHIGWKLAIWFIIPLIALAFLIGLIASIGNKDVATEGKMTLFIFALLFIIAEFIMVLLFKHNIKKGNWLKYMQLNYESIYENAFKKLNKKLENFNFQNSGAISSEIEQTKTWLNVIPHEARMIKLTNLASFEINKNQFQVQMSTFHWVVTTNKTRKEYYQPFGLIKAKIDENNPLSEKFSFTLNPFEKPGIFERKNIENLENKNFVKKFNPITNDGVKARMAFTPLAMEEMLENFKGVIPNKFLIQKRDHIILTPFHPLREDLLVLDFDYIKYAKKSSNFVAQKILRDLSTDVYEIYSLIDFLFYPEMMKD